MEFTPLITHNRIAQFAARFEMPSDDSVIYYHPNGLFEDFHFTLGTTFIVMANLTMSVIWMFARTE